MAMCFVPKCLHKTGVHKCKMHSFPRSPRKKLKWARLIRRGLDSPTKNSRVCSCHFKGHPKEVCPTEFPWNADKRLVFRSPGKRRCSTTKAFIVRRSLAFDGGSDCVVTSSGTLHKTELKSLEEPSSTESTSTNVEEEIIPLPQASPTVEDLESDSSQSPLPHVSPMVEDNNMEVDSSKSIQPFCLSKSPSNSTTTSADCQGKVFLHNPDDQQVEVPLDTANENKFEKVDVEHLKAENANLRCQLEDLKRKFVESFAVVHEAENTLLRGENERLKKELEESKVMFSFKKISHSNDLVRHYTGLPNRETFYALLKLCSNVDIQYVKGWKVVKLDHEQQLFLTLLKLRRNLSNLDLGVRFGVGDTTVANIFVSWVLLLHHVLVDCIMSIIPSRQKNQINLPGCFSAYPHTRMIMDCTEISTANPNLLSDQNKMYSSYKHRITSKALVVIAPNGTVTYASKLFPGSISDRNMVIKSGILNSLVPGDSVMADKGFNIGDIMPDGVALNIPPFKEVPQFTKEQIQQTLEIAQARIHIERANARIKNFKILDFIPQFLLPYASEIFQVSAALTNLQNPLIKIDESDD